MNNGAIPYLKKIWDHKIQNDSRELYGSIQHDAEGGVLDCPYNLSDEFWIFDPRFLKVWDRHSNMIQ